MTWLRKKRIPGFAPRGDEVIGTTTNGQGVTISQEFWRWLSLLATRLQNNVEAPGTIKMTGAAVEPEGWLFLNGQAVDEGLYPALAEIFGASGGIITLPDYSDRIPMGAGPLVPLNDTAGAATVTLTRTEMPKHNHGVSDPGHLHGATDRGHTHGPQMDSHTHTVGEDPDNQHTHPVTDASHTHSTSQSNHTHSGGLAFTAGNELAAGSDFPRPISATTGGATANISILSSNTGITTTGEPTSPLVLEASDAEVDGTVLKSQADIRVHKAKTNITTLDDGEGQPFSIIPPVFGVNWMVKT